MNVPPGPAPGTVGAPVFLARLLLGVAAVAAIVVGLTWSALEQSRQEQRERAVVTTQNMAQLLEQYLTGALEKSDIALLGVAHEYAEQLAEGRIDAPRLNAYVERLASQLSFVDGMGIADERGFVSYGVRVLPGAKANIADRDYFLRLRDDPRAGLIWSSPVLGRVSGKWLINLARRIDRPDGSFAGVVYAGVWLETLSRTFARLDVGAQGLVTLRDADFKLIVRHPELPGGPSVGRTTLTPELAALVAAGQDHGTYTGRSLLDGVERTHSYRRLPGQPLYVTVGLGVEESLRGWRAEAFKAGSLAGFFLLGMLVAAAALFRSWKRRAAAVAALFARDAELRLAASVVASTMDGVLVTDTAATILSVNAAFTEITGYTAGEAVGRKPSLLRSDHHGVEFYRAMWDTLARTGRWQGEIWNRRKSGEAYLEWLTINAVTGPDGRPERYVAVFSDITELYRKGEGIRHLAFHDPLTGLPNRALLQDRLEHGLAYARREERRLGVLFVDLDGFKPINDTLGHDVGDGVLQEVARRLLDNVRQSDTVARQGGDEFVVLVEHTDGAEAMAALADKVLAALAVPMVIGEHTLHVGASIGVACFPDDGGTPPELMRRADAAMYAAKAAGRGTWRLSQIKAAGEVRQ